MSLRIAWQKLPAARRHFYFFTLLFLLTLMLGHVREDLATLEHALSAPPASLRITSQGSRPAQDNL